LSKYLIELFSKNPERFGVLLALIGVLVLTPDTLVIRISELEKWPLMGWRGLLMGTASLIIWRTFLVKDPSREWRSLLSWQGVLVITAFSMNSATFTLGIVETSASVVLTAVATMPVFAAVLSFLMLREKQDWLGWLAIFVSMCGVIIVVMDGNNALASPEGSVKLGAIYGVLTAIGLAFTFTMARKYQQLSILPAAAVGAVISGLIGLWLSDISVITETPIWPVLTMGLIILPVSFTFLNLAARYTSSAIISLLMLLEMVLGPVWVWLGIGERPTTTMIIGAVIVFVTLTFHILRTHWPPQN
jgi:drug/metabolite transporter (DMT)-like permease